MGAVSLPVVEWAAASRAAGRGGEPGDACLVKPVEQGTVIAVVDGLGHGPEAVIAAKRALLTIERSQHTSPPALVLECHRALQATRGVVMGLALVDSRANALTWVGIGDVRALLCRAEPVGPSSQDALYAHNGVVGRTLPPLRPVMRALIPGDTVIVTTDGIRGGFVPPPGGGESPERVASELLERYAVATDDALVLVARYRGASS
jgi:hypothetical protein